MQNIVTLFGPTGAARYLELVASNYRKPCWTLEALNDDGTVLLDLSAYLQSWNINSTDESGVCQRATFVLAPGDARFDPYPVGIGGIGGRGPL